VIKNGPNTYPVAPDGPVQADFDFTQTFGEGAEQSSFCGSSACVEVVTGPDGRILGLVRTVGGVAVAGFAVDQQEFNTFVTNARSQAFDPLLVAE
jgi:hypothetical protein